MESVASVASSSLESQNMGSPNLALASKRKRKVENFASVSSSIMMRLPTRNLGSLRSIFTSKAEGLNLTEFLEAVINNMELPDSEMLMLMVADLTDFFQLVDINGDGHMEWEEFVMFILDAVVQDSDTSLMERLSLAGQNLLQPPSSRCAVQCIRFAPSLNKIILGVGTSIQFFAPDEENPNISTLAYSFHVQDDSSSMSKQFSIIDIQYIASQDTLCVLKDNLSVNFYKLRMPSNISVDTVEKLGIHRFPQAYIKIVFRDILKQDIRIFSICSSKSIDTWKCTFKRWQTPEFSDLKSLTQHTDYIRDIVTAVTPAFKYLVSGGLDKTIQVWDLETLKYRFSRSGHQSGIQCLAFDNSRCIFAGGFDFTILGWDLSATLDRPAIQLTGHKFPICKIVPLGALERCCSLDERGILCWWDISLSNPTDDTRFIHSTCAPQDRLKTFDVFLNLGVDFHTQHGCVVVSGGRKQWNYRITDSSPDESAPITVLFSTTLLSLITVHLTDIIFWSAVTAVRFKTLNNIFGSESHTRVCTACLDDRGRKLYVGDTSGHIGVYNCLNGLKLSSIFVMPNAAIRELIYSPDKLLIAVAGSSDLLIIDEYFVPVVADPLMGQVALAALAAAKAEAERTAVTNATEWVLRQVVAHETDIQSIVYSAPLGLIATLDLSGELCVWDYQYLQLKFIFPNCCGPNIDAGALAFLYPYPLLLVTGSDGGLTVVPVGTATKTSQGKRIYRVRPIIDRKRMYSADEELDLSASFALATAGLTSQILNENNKNSDDEPEENELTGSKAKPYDKRHIMRYKKKRNRQCTSCFMDVQWEPLDTMSLHSLSVGNASLSTTSEEITAKYILSAKPGVLEDINTESSVPLIEIPLSIPPGPENITNNTVTNISIIEDKPLDNSGEEILIEPMKIEAIIYPASVTITDSSASPREPKFMKSREPILEMENRKEVIRIVCGHNDGTVAILDVTELLKGTIQIDTMNPEDFVSTAATFNCYRRILRGPVRDGDERSKTWAYNDVLARERNCSCYFALVWRPHDIAINHITMIGDKKHILTCSEDSAIYAWDIEAKFMGTLTRGRDLDKVFRKTWIQPIDLEARDIRRSMEAVKLVEENNLVEEEDHSTLADDQGQPVGSFIRLTRTTSTPIHHSKNVSSTLLPNEKSHQAESGSDIILSKTFSEKVIDFTVKGDITAKELNRVTRAAMELPDRERLIAQLEGAITFAPSKRDFTHILVADREQDLINNIWNPVIADKKKKKKSKKKSTKASSKQFDESEMSNQKYIETIRSADEFINSAVMRKEEKKVKMKKWDHEQELDEVDATDPDNWALKSLNRKREMYGAWFFEMTKQGFVNDRMNIINAKLDGLCEAEGNSFQNFLHVIRDKFHKMAEERALKKKLKKDAKSKESMDKIKEQNEIVSLSHASSKPQKLFQGKEDKITKEKKTKKPIREAPITSTDNLPFINQSHAVESSPEIKLDNEPIQLASINRRASIKLVKPRRQTVVFHAEALPVYKKVVSLGRLGELPNIQEVELKIPGKVSTTKQSVVSQDILQPQQQPPSTDDSIQWFSLDKGNKQSKLGPTSISNKPNKVKVDDISNVDSAINGGRYVSYTSTASILSEDLKTAPSNESVSRFSRSNLPNVNIRDAMDHTSSKPLWKLTASAPAPIGHFIGTQSAEPKCVDPVMIRNKEIAQRQEEEFVNFSLRQSMRPHLTLDYLGNSDEESMEWIPRSRSPVMLDKTAETNRPPSPAPATPLSSPPPKSVVKTESEIKSSTLELSINTSNQITEESSSKTISQSSPSVLPRTMTRSATVPVLITAEEHQRCTRDSLKRFEDVVKPMSDSQYARSIRLQKGTAEVAKKKRRKRSSRDENDHIQRRTRPIEIEKILTFQAQNAQRSSPEDVIPKSAQMNKRTNSYYFSSINEDEELKPVEEINAQKAEESWIRKVQYTLRGDETLGLTKSVFTVNKEKKEKAAGNKFENLGDIGDSAARIAAENKRILSRPSFGTARVDELLNLREAFLNIVRDSMLKEAQYSIEQLGAIPDFSQVLFSTNQTVSIFDFMSSKFITSRKNYRYLLKKYVEGMEQTGKLKESTSMSKILKQLFPLMPVSDHRDCLKYFMLKELVKDDMEEEEVPLSAEELEKLRVMFNFFDQDKSGFVDQREIMEKLQREDKLNPNVMDSEDSFREGAKVEDSHVLKLIQAVDEDANAELDFDEFCKLFRGAF